MASVSISETETVKSKNGTRIIYYGRLPELKAPTTTIVQKMEILETKIRDNEFASPSESPNKYDLSNLKSLCVDVIVKNAVSPLNFKIQNYRQSVNLQKLESEMSTFYATTSGKALKFQDLSLHGHYAVKYFIDAPATTHGKEERWVRCQIMKPFKENMPILTYLIDHGIYHATEPTCIQPLKKIYLDLPVQSYEAKLHFVEASKQHFTPEDCLRFQKRVEGKPFYGIIVPNSELKSKETELRIILIDTSTAKDEYIHQQFIKIKLKQIK